MMNWERLKLGYREITMMRGIVHKIGEVVGVGFDFQGEKEEEEEEE